jgi:micrococcal nuclease
MKNVPSTLLRIFLGGLPLMFDTGHTPVHAAEILPGPYPAELVRVIDGDTVEARVHIWLGLDQTVRLRIRDIDAPEMHGHCPGEREAAAAARDFLIELLGTEPLALTRIAFDKYGGRVDATIHLPSGKDVGAAMLAARHARPWPHPKGELKCPPFPPVTDGVEPRR